MRTYHEKILDEIMQVIKDNLELLYNYDDDALINIRKYCYQNNHNKYKPLTYNQLICFTEEAIAELVNIPYLYDFRSLE